MFSTPPPPFCLFQALPLILCLRFFSPMSVRNWARCWMTTARTKVAVKAGAADQRSLVGNPWFALVREVTLVRSPGGRLGLAKGRGRQGNSCPTGRRIKPLSRWVCDKFVDGARLTRSGGRFLFLLCSTCKLSCVCFACYYRDSVGKKEKNTSTLLYIVSIISYFSPPSPTRRPVTDPHRPQPEGILSIPPRSSTNSASTHHAGSNHVNHPGQQPIGATGSVGGGGSMTKPAAPSPSQGRPTQQQQKKSANPSPHHHPHAPSHATQHPNHREPPQQQQQHNGYRREPTAAMAAGAYGGGGGGGGSVATPDERSMPPGRWEAPVEAAPQQPQPPPPQPRGYFRDPSLTDGDVYRGPGGVGVGAGETPPPQGASGQWVPRGGGTTGGGAGVGGAVYGSRESSGGHGSGAAAPPTNETQFGHMAPCWRLLERAEEFMEKVRFFFFPHSCR